MLVIPDRRLVALVAKGVKTTHRIPAKVDDEGGVTHPKITPSSEARRDKTPYHKVYLRAPFGAYGNPNEQPLLEIEPLTVVMEMLADMDDGDANAEGFKTVAAYRRFWDKVQRSYNRPWDEWLYKPVWVIGFQMHKVLPAGYDLLDDLRLEADL